MKTPSMICALALAGILAARPLAGASETPGSPLPSSAAAKPPAAAEARPITLAGAREAALSLSRTLRKALLDVDAAKLAQKTRSYQNLPSLATKASAGLSYASTGSALESFRASLGISATQTIYDGGRNAALAAIDAIDGSVAREAARSAYFAAVKGAEQAYFAALQTAAAQEAAKSDLEASRTHLELARAKFEAGMIAKPAVLKVESEAAAKETALSQAKRAAATAAWKLSSITGLPAGAALANDGNGESETLAIRIGSLSDQETEALVATLQAAALKNNPDIVKAALGTARALGEVTYASKGGLPTVAASWSHDVSYGPASGIEPLGGSLSLTASLPMDAWATKTTVETKKVLASEAELDQGETLASIRLELRGAVYSAIANARAIASSKKALEYSEGNYASQLEVFRLSSLSFSDLSDAEVLLSSSRSSLIAARYDFLSGLSSLRALAGYEDEALLAAALP